MAKWFVVALLVSLWVSGAARAYGYPEIVSEQGDSRLEEVSGLASSFAQPRYFWVINDGGNEPSLILVDQQGAYSDKVVLHSLGNHDWEDLETFRHRGKNYIAIADIGDNFSRRKVYYVHLVPEPTVSITGDIGELDSAGIKTIAFQYEDGPRDAEALGIDLDNERILVLSKRDRPPRMYAVPFTLSPKRFVYRAKHLTSVEALGRMSLSGGYLSQTFYAGQPTAMTVVPQLLSTRIEQPTQLVVLSYGAVRWFELMQHPVAMREILTIQLPAMPQAEALAVDASGDVTVMSEVVGSKVVRIQKLM